MDRWSAPHIVTPPPGPKSRQYMAREKRLFFATWYTDKDVPAIFRRKKGWTLEDVDGNRYIDMATGWASTPLGAVHDEVMEATVAALWESGVECTDYVTFTHLFDLAEKLVQVSPSNLTRVAPDTTGTEAVEAALRLMREASGRPFVITFHGQSQRLLRGVVIWGCGKGSASSSPLKLPGRTLNMTPRSLQKRLAAASSCSLYLYNI